MMNYSIPNQFVSNNNLYSTNQSFNSQTINSNKNYQRNNIFNENLLYTPKIIENDDQVKKNITEQIKNVKNIFQKFNFRLKKSWRKRLQNKQLRLVVKNKKRKIKFLYYKFN